MKAHVKSQASTEFIVIITGILIIIVILVTANMEVLTAHENNVRIIQAKDTVDSIYKSAFHVYRQGEHSKEKIFVKIPNGIESTKLEQGLIQIKLSVDGIERSVFRTTRFNITGNIPTEEGYYWLNIISRGNYVEVTE